ncbi:MAG: hypothetical protein WCO56_13870 [Verrucomicrobiota bacterium]
MKAWLLIGLVVVSSVCMNGADQTAKCTFSNQGYSIAPLDEAPAGDTTYHCLTMFMPVSDGFAPNVVVQLQRYTGTIAEYVALSKLSLAAQGMTITKESATETTVVFEYKGTFKGRPLHWYAKAVKNGAKVVLATAAATEGQWKTASEKLLKCVNSAEAN